MGQIYITSDPTDAAKIGDRAVSSTNPVPVVLTSSAAASGAAVTDAGSSRTCVLGVSGAVVTTTDNTLTAVTDAPTSGQKIVLDDLIVSADAACNVLFEIETTGTDLFRIFFAGAGTVQFTPRGRLKLATADKKLTIKASTTVNVYTLAIYHSEA